MQFLFPVGCVLLLLALPLEASCLALAPPPAGSECQVQSSQIIWLSRPVQEAPVIPGPGAYDAAIHDPAFASGRRVSGTHRFQLAVSGEYFVEVFLFLPQTERVPFRLLQGENLLDERPVIAPGPPRLRPRSGQRRISLLGIITAPAEFSVQSGAPQYGLSAVRITPLPQYQRRVLAKLSERANTCHARIITEAEGRPLSRRDCLEQLGDRLLFSDKPEVRREGLLHLTRAWYWLAAENHEPDDLLQTRLLLERCFREIPAHPIVRQMISASCTALSTPRGMVQGPFCDQVQPVGWELNLPAPPDHAPAWAVAQRAMKHRMETITRWWVEKRQAPNGELGGGWEDDVEILRHWGPLALGFGSEPAIRGMVRLADGLWNSGQLANGYSKVVSDVEHSSEPTTDTLPLRAAVEPANPDARARLAATAACAFHWIRPQPDGFWRFRSSWFNCTEADLRPPRALDVHLNTRAMGPALWHAYLSRDERLILLLRRWADSWIKAMRSNAHGKPAGLFPSILRSADGSYRIGTGAWDKPQAERDYFQWSGQSQEALTCLVLAVHDLTGDQAYLDAAGETFAVLDRCATLPAYCQAIKENPGAFYRWRRLTGNPRYDAFFGYESASSEEAILAEATRLARETEQRLAYNFDMFTSEVLYTDRVYYPLPPALRLRLFGGDSPRGDRYPFFDISWPATAAEAARLVLAASPAGLRIRLFSFDQASVPLKALLWGLQPGRHRWTLIRTLDGAEVDSGRLEASQGGRPWTLEIFVPPQEEVTFMIAPE